jgi:hypothetical protein
MAAVESAFGFSNKFILHIDATEISIDTVNNRSLISVDAYVKDVSYSGSAIFNFDPTYGHVNIAGDNPQYTIGGYSFSSPGQFFYLVQGRQAWIGHDGNGDASVFIGADYDGQNSPFLNATSTSMVMGLSHINRFANVTSYAVDTVTDEGITAHINTDVNCSLIQFSIDGGSTWFSAGSGTYAQVVFHNLRSGTAFNVVARVTRADNGLVSTTGTIPVTTGLQNNFFGFL